MAHIALTDNSAKTHYHDERITRGAAGLAGVEKKPFKVWLEDWQIMGTDNGAFPWQVSVKNKDFALDLTLTPSKPVVLQGNAGNILNTPITILIMHKPQKEKQKQENWYSQDFKTVLSKFHVASDSGLTSQEVQKKQQQFGTNEIISVGQRGALQLLISQFTDFMILVLIAAAAISGYVGEPTDAIVILVIVLLNAIIGFIQDYRAEKALEALRKMAASHARVRRDGQYQDIQAEELVPGDIIFLEAGNIIPADLRLIETADLQVDEAALTGESEAVNKITRPLQDNIHALGDHLNMAFKGCMVTKGRGTGVCVSTGMNTEFGKIATLLQNGQGSGSNKKTPLQHRLARFSKRLSLIILLICGIIFTIGFLKGEPAPLMFLTAVSLAVAAIPEALPAVITVSLAFGAKRMVKSNALIRRLPAVEALGSVTYICSDKTGTLTQNRMSMEAIYTDNTLHKSFPEAENSNNHKDNYLWNTIGKALALNNDVQSDADNIILGDPTEIALFEAVQNIGYSKIDLQKTMPRIGEIAFSSERKRMTTLHSSNSIDSIDGTDNTKSKVIAFSKGAPEVIISLCTDMLTEEGTTNLPVKELQQAAENLAKKGYRILAVAYRNFNCTPEEIRGNLSEETVENSMTFLALLALIDPPRDGAEESVSQCRSAGIIPVMITGDHPSTALAIAKRLGIANEQDNVIGGEELANLSDAELKQTVINTSVYARVNPEQKIRIVEALQSHHQFVAMTGDGVNDAPALKRADVGVAMGKIGTEVAREASQLVLLDDNFKTIVIAVREGRRIFDNIRKFIKYTMTSNTGEILTLLIAPLLGMPIPLLPIHILWINLVTDGLPGLALSVEPEENGVMQRPPRPAKESIFSHGMWQHMVWVGFLIAALSLSSLAWANVQGSDNWQTMVFTTLTFAQLVHVMVIRSERDSLFTLGLWSNPLLLLTIVLTIGLQLLVIYVPVLQTIFKTQALSGIELGVCTLLASVVFFAVEIEKWLVRRGVLYRELAVKK
ncbi:Calcium-transporting ATPase 1 [Nymphon striatum]|nr:Calcium-transporting ATPase 1 [Nymphon striatum]